MKIATEHRHDSITNKLINVSTLTNYFFYDGIKVIFVFINQVEPGNGLPIVRSQT